MFKIDDLFPSWISSGRIALIGVLLCAVVGGVQQIRIHLLQADLKVEKADRLAADSACENAIGKLQNVIREQNDGINALWLAGKSADQAAVIRSQEVQLQTERSRRQAASAPAGPKGMNAWMQAEFP